MTTRQSGVLQVCMGNLQTLGLHIHHDGDMKGQRKRGDTDSFNAAIQSWTAAAVKTTVRGTRDSMLRIIEPAETIDEIRHGDLYVRGHFRLVDFENKYTYVKQRWRTWPVERRLAVRLGLSSYDGELRVHYNPPGGRRKADWLIELQTPDGVVRGRGATEDEAQNAFTSLLTEHQEADVETG